MAPPISKEVREILHDLYYRQYMTFGRNKLFEYCKANKIPISQRQVMDWLSSQQVHQLYAPVKIHKHQIKPTILRKARDQVAIDLIDMQNFEYNGYRYILTCIDLFSKYVWAVPIKNKEDSTVKNAMEKLIKSKSMKGVRSIRSDRGSEFIADVFKNMLTKHKVTQVLSTAKLPQSNGNIEITNRTIKNALRKAIKIAKSYDWVKILPTIIKNINSTISHTTKKTPNEVHNEVNKQALDNVHKNIKKARVKKNESFEKQLSVGDRVRLKLGEDDRDRYNQNYSNEIYTISHVTKPKNKITATQYSLTGKREVFYDTDLLHVHSVENKLTNPETWEISKIKTPMFANGVASYEVAWKYYRNQNTIEPRDQLMEDIPKMLKLWEKKHNVEWNMKTKRVKWDHEI
jgi:transposase InsO family protein